MGAASLSPAAGRRQAAETARRSLRFLDQRAWLREREWNWTHWDFLGAVLMSTEYRALTNAASDVYVLCARKHADRESGEFYPSQSAIARAAGLNRRTVGDALAALERHGLIERTPETKKSRAGLINVYRLRVPRSVFYALSPPTEDEDRERGRSVSARPRAGHELADDPGRRLGAASTATASTAGASETQGSAGVEPGGRGVTRATLEGDLADYLQCLALMPTDTTLSPGDYHLVIDTSRSLAREYREEGGDDLARSLERAAGGWDAEVALRNPELVQRCLRERGARLRARRLLDRGATQDRHGS